MSKTGAGLATWVKNILSADTHVYWYGTYCNPCNNSLLTGKTKQYPSHYKADRQKTYKSHITQGKIATDCVGLIKGYHWELDGVVKYNRNKLPDFSASQMYQYAKVKGSIDTLPEIPGVLVWVGDKSHIGVYLGNGYIGEARNFTHGVQLNALNERNFKYWGLDPYISYTAEEKDIALKAAGKSATSSSSGTSLRKGDRGAAVKDMQDLLLKAGYKLPVYGADGSFGAETLKALKSFQANNGLDVDGVYGPKTRAKLTSSSAVSNVQSTVNVTMKGTFKSSYDGQLVVTMNIEDARQLAKQLSAL